MMQIEQINNMVDLESAFAIRKKVFVEEQKCPEDEEYEYEEESTHYLATIDGVPAGTARWRRTDKGI